MRETPQNIDRSVKLMEYAMAFMMPALLCFPIFELWAIPIAAVVCGTVIKFTAGKPPGFMEEWIYRKGIGIGELMPHDVHRLVK